MVRCPNPQTRCKHEKTSPKPKTPYAKNIFKKTAKPYTKAPPQTKKKDHLNRSIGLKAQATWGARPPAEPAALFQTDTTEQHVLFSILTSFKLSINLNISKLF